MMTFHKAKPSERRSSGRPFSGMAGREISSIFLRGAAGLLLVCLISAFFEPPGCAAQKAKTQVDLLIARNQVQDPYFHHSVVLMLPEAETQLVVGLIINKPTHLTLRRLFPDSPEMKGRTEAAYFGGPVDVRTPSIVFRSSTEPDDAVRLYGNVYLTFDSDLITKAFQERQTSSRMRLFLGRAQWAPGQLQNEIRQGGWYRIQAEGDLVFSPHPDNLWPTLHSRAAPSKYIRYEVPAHARKPSASDPDVM
jgi:putative transcriptional regulator